MAVVNNLKTIREQHNLNQEELASGAGATRESIGRYERGERNPSLEMALRLAAYLNMTVEELFHLDKESLTGIDDQNNI
jgi:putative transcriptional regulator